MTPGVLLVHHPGAGEGDAQTARERLIDAVERQGLGPVEYRQWSDDLAPLVASDERVVVVSGGDGTVASVLLAGSGRRAPIGALPSGTANNIAASLGIDVDDLDRAAQALSTGRIVPFDLPTARTAHVDRRFTESVGVGLFAQLLAEADTRGDLDLRGARMLMREVVRAAAAWPARVVVDGVARECRLLGVQVMNIGRAGPGIELARTAAVDDRRAAVVLLEEVHRADLLEVLDAHLDDSTVRIPLPAWSGGLVTVECLEPAPMTIDDDLLEPSATISVTYEDGVNVPMVVP